MAKVDLIWERNTESTERIHLRGLEQGTDRIHCINIHRRPPTQLCLPKPFHQFHLFLTVTFGKRQDSMHFHHYLTGRNDTHISSLSKAMELVSGHLAHTPQFSDSKSPSFFSRAGCFLEQSRGMA